MMAFILLLMYDCVVNCLQLMTCMLLLVYYYGAYVVQFFSAVVYLLYDCVVYFLQSVPVIFLLVYDCGEYVLKLFCVIILMLYDCGVYCLQSVSVIFLLVYDCGVYVSKLFCVTVLMLYDCVVYVSKLICVTVLMLHDCVVYCLQSVPVILMLVYDCVLYCLQSVPVILRLVYDCVVYMRGMLSSIIQCAFAFFTNLLFGIENWISNCWVCLIDLFRWMYSGSIDSFQDLGRTAATCVARLLNNSEIFKNYFYGLLDRYDIPYRLPIIICALVLIFSIALMYDNVPINKSSNPISPVNENPVDKTMLESINRYITTTWDERLVGIGRDAKNLLSQSNIHIVSAKHVVNATLLETYNNKRDTIRSRGNCVPVCQLPNCSRQVESRDCLSALHTCTEVNEVFLLHGTKSGNVSNIVSEGLKVSKSRNGLFGYGLYFAECSTKADQYTDERNNRSPLGTCLYMLLCRVTLGRVYVTNERIHSSEIDKNKYDSLLFDPPKGQGLFREFVVFDSSQVMPTIVIQYQRKSLEY